MELGRVLKVGIFEAPRVEVCLIKCQFVVVVLWSRLYDMTAHDSVSQPSNLRND